MKQLLLYILSSLPVAGLAQAPTVLAVAPQANAPAVPRTSPLTITFSQPVTAASAGALQVFSGQRGGRRTATAPAVASGSTLRFVPTAYAWQPGELVQYTTMRTASSAGGPLAQPWVGQFRAAVSQATPGTLQGGSEPTVGSAPTGVAAGDVDGDGDVDFVAANSNGHTVSVRLNLGNATFGGSQEVPVGTSPHDVALGDVDGDGDLDLVVACSFLGTGVCVRLNDGTGQFATGQDLTSAQCNRLSLIDVDGDADLDILTLEGGNTVTLSLNNGRGLFGYKQSVRVGDGAYDLATGDIDNDGDIDLLTANNNANTVSIRLNDGSGTFSGALEVTVGNNPSVLAVGDLDNDGDLDVVTANDSSHNVTVRLNAGNTTFTNGASLTFYGITGLHLADIDGDHDLDLLLTNVSSAYSSRYNTVNVRLNDGKGNFAGGQDLFVGPSPRCPITADLDSDGDLDLLTANYSTTISVRLNGGSALAAAPVRQASAETLFPNPAHRMAMLSGALPLGPVVVLDALGRPVLHTTTDASGAATLALPAELPAGAYLVRSGTQVQRLLVE